MVRVNLAFAPHAMEQITPRVRRCRFCGVEAHAIHSISGQRSRPNWRYGVAWWRHRGTGEAKVCRRCDDGLRWPWCRTHRYDRADTPRGSTVLYTETSP